MDSFDHWGWTIDERLQREATLDTGKTHVATALGVQAIVHHRKRVRFFFIVKLVNALEQEKSLGRAGQITNLLVQSDLVILDELDLSYPAGPVMDESW